MVKTNTFSSNSTFNSTPHNYAIPEKPVVGGDIVEFYTSMTLNEFDKYIMSIYDGSYYDTEAPSLKNASGGERLEIRREYYVADYAD